MHKRNEFFDDLDELSESIAKPIVVQGKIGKLFDTYNKVSRSYDFRGYFKIAEKRSMVYDIEKNIIEDVKDIDYDERDLVKLLNVMRVKDMDKHETNAFGAYFGSLISILTERNENKGKGTFVEISENSINCLGLYCRKFDRIKITGSSSGALLIGAKEGNEIVLENCHGNNALEFAGTYGGRIGNIVIRGYEGDNCCGGVGGDSGHVERIFMSNVKGYEFGHHIAETRGRVALVVISDSNGEGSGSSIGNGGSVRTVVMNKIKGDCCGSGLGFRMGNVGQVIMNNVEGDWCGGNIGDSGKVENVYARNIKGDFAIGHCGKDKGSVEIAVLENMEGKNLLEESEFKKVIRTESASEEDKQYMEKKGMDMVISIVQTFDGCNAEEIFEKAKEIDKIYRKFRGESNG